MWPWSSAKKKLFRAAKEGDATAVRDLLIKRLDLDVDARDEYGWTALHWASMPGHAHVVELLLNAHAAVDAPTKDGRTALHIASYWAFVKVAELLLKTRANVDATDELGRTPLHRACDRHHSDLVNMLLKSGASIHAKDESGLMPLHKVILRFNEYASVTFKTLKTVQLLVAFGATWDAKCDELVVARLTYDEAPALALCIQVWTQELAEGLPFTDIPIETVKRGIANTKTYVGNLKSSRDIILRRKICLVGPSCAGKSSFVKSITTRKPQLVHLDDRTIGIDHFPLRFKQDAANRDHVKIHEVTFWDFAGQDAYQVAHSLFFSPRTLFLVCIDLEAFTLAYMQALIMSSLKKQETQLMGEFIERTVMKWIRLIMSRQPDAEFVFIITKEDLLVENSVTERLLKKTLEANLKDVEATTQEMRSKVEVTESSPSREALSTRGPSSVYSSCMSLESVRSARSIAEELICKSDRSFQMPDKYTQALATIVAMRAEAKANDITKRINRVFAPVDTLPTQLQLEPEECQNVLQTLHDLGDVLWYEDLGVELFKDRVILDPLLLIDFIRQVINHNHTGQTMSHADLKAQPFWNGLENDRQMQALKQVLQEFHLVYPANETGTMAWDSDLIVPAYWQTKTPASWLFLGDILRINETKSCDGEAFRVHWEYHFEYGLPSTLFDHFVVASVSPYFTFDAGPDWIVYEEKEIAACRIMVGRDPRSLHRTIHVEAVLAESATDTQSASLWGNFRQLAGTFVGVMREYPGLVVSSFAWDDKHNKINLSRPFESAVQAPLVSWMPPPDIVVAVQASRCRSGLKHQMV